jgi:8-oxo-dGTP pyrophosphatase MutT (NUDIX family)
MSAEAVPAATLLLLREGETPLEVFMVVRHHQIDFASGALVFPGGKVDAHDAHPALAGLCDGAAEDASLRSIQIAAIREAFEECGVLLARRNGEAQLIGAEALAKLESYRDRLHSGEVRLEDFLNEHQLRLACDKLVYFAHWVTPEGLPKRFDTHFYLVEAPPDHVALHDGHESVDSVWIAPDAALEGAGDGTYTVIFPTLRNIELLARAHTVGEAMTLAAARQVVTVQPWTEKRDDGSYVCIPADAGYEVTEERIPGR